MRDLYQWLIIAFVVLSILYHVWKGGAANPQSTGSLDRKVNILSGQMTGLSGRVGQVETQMKEMKEEAASTKDVEKLEDLIDARMATVRAEIEGHRNLSQATNESVRRIERVLIEKGLGK